MEYMLYILPDQNCCLGVWYWTRDSEYRSPVLGSETLPFIKQARQHLFTIFYIIIWRNQQVVSSFVFVLINFKHSRRILATSIDGRVTEF